MVSNKLVDELLAQNKEMQQLLNQILARVNGQEAANDGGTMNMEEVSELTGYSRHSIYRFIKENKIPSYKIGRKYMFYRNEINQWLFENSVRSTK